MDSTHASPQTSPPRAAYMAAMALALAGLVTGCPDLPPEPTEDAGSSLIGRDSACKLTGRLELALGQGESPLEFTPLGQGAEPTLYYGPQGGMHLMLGVRVENPALQFPGLQVDFKAERQRCGVDGGCLPFETMGRYLAVVQEAERLLLLEGGALAASGLLVVVSDWSQDERRRIQVEVIDRCGRRGGTSLEFEPGPP